MKQFFVFIGIALFIVACGGSGTPPEGGNSNSEKSLVSKGEKIFKSNCITCHGIDGRLQLNGAKELPLSTLTLDERIAVITNGRKLMTPFKGILSEKKIKAVAEYTMTFSDDK